MRVQPSDVQQPTLTPHHGRNPASPQRKLVALLGCVYLAATMASSMWYLSMLNPSFANDLWWVNYTTRGHQALVIDLFNSMLTTQSTGAIDILAPRWTMAKTYDDREPTTDIYPTYPRRLVLNELTTVEFAVANLRELSAHWSVYMSTQYCWVDLDREFEIAHTDARQQRCVDRYRGNGAVYMETVLRAQEWNTFQATYGGDSGPFTVAIQTWLEQVPRGQQWLATTSTARETTTLAQEAAYWRAANISYFQLQWQNNMQSGVSESSAIVNALGLAYDVTLKKMSLTKQSWTSVAMNWMVVNDLYQMQWFNASLIRSANNSFLQLPATIEDMLGLADNQGNYIDQLDALRTAVGPFLAVDMFVVAVPNALVRLYETFHTVVGAKPALYDAIDAMAATTIFPTPRRWSNSNVLYYGGNPMCLYGEPLPYIQDTFGFGDTCNSQLPLRVTIETKSGLFAALVMRNDGSALCNLQSTFATCLDYIQAIANLSQTLASSTFVSTLVPPAMDAIARLRVGIMQFTSNINGSNWTVLHQPILDGDDGWDFVGWVVLFDWVQGKREVVSFEGDVTSLALISTAESAVRFPSNADTVTSATRLVYYVVAYTTLVLGILALSCVVIAIQLGFQLNSTNLFWFNRIVGSIWIGRPLLFARGMTSLVVLSTTRLTLAERSGQTRFESPRRSPFATMVLAGEATWLVYVVQDALTVLMQRSTKTYGPWSCLVTWTMLVVLECMSPVCPQLSLHRHCTAKNMDLTVKCSSGVLAIGDIQRLHVICILFGSVTVGIAIMDCIIKRFKLVAPRGDCRNRHLLGVGDHFIEFECARGDHTRWHLDAVACLMAGIVPMGWRGTKYTFDIKLWVLDQDNTHTKASTKSFLFHVERLKATNLTIPDTCIPSKPQLPLQRHFTPLVGVMYTIASIVGSVSYLQVSQLNLDNDLFWASFNSTGVHTFVGNWLNMQLTLGVRNMTLQLNTNWINRDGANTGSTGVINAPSNYGARMLYSELNALEDTIIGLRNTDGCAAPWIFTQYCFVDFNQRWEMANSAVRQLRCQHMTTNGAVFMETVLRNIPFREFTACWGRAFEPSIASELRKTSFGQDWITSATSELKGTVNDEVALWISLRINRFETQWQNFKRIGLTNQYAVRNAFGTLYPYAIQIQHTSFRLNDQTTFKMYWGPANDFYAVGRNSSGMGGSSLIRSSPDFAFANTTPFTVLALNGTFKLPLSSVFTIVTSAVGPFGSVDMSFVPCPEEASAAVRKLMQVVRSVLFDGNGAAQFAYATISNPLSNMAPVPKAWTDINFITLGSSLLCPEIQFAAGYPVSSGLLQFLSWQESCSSIALSAILETSVEFMLVSAIMANLTESTTDAIAHTCRQNPSNVDSCNLFLNQTVDFVATYMVPQLNDFSPYVATTAIQALKVEFVQFGQLDAISPLQLYRINVLDPTEIGFTYFAWNFLVEWALGYREAVAFEGDHGTLTVLTNFLTSVALEVTGAETATAMAFYLRHTVMSITGAMIVLALVALLYIVVSRGRVEIWNLFLLERVGALVWCGRPLLFLRSLTAIVLLSTSTLHLVFSGNISYFDVTSTPWYTTLLAANEVTWMVAIVNDIAMAVTRDYTPYYATLNSILVWLVTLTLSFLLPISHSLTIAKQCQIVQVDFQVSCDCGQLTLGHLSRLATVVCVVTCCNALCYAATRCIVGRPAPATVQSIFVHAGARYLFTTATWVCRDVYYMDRMSAALNGILTFRWGDKIHGFDVKLWCIFRVAAPADVLIPANHALAPAAQYALPLSLYKT
ncbi:Aste57867_23098 [Aphanomyces stellatus]|uniref:Aste57867_23098 protein n=1 Tax=Aphanomyces stellatus TaxID=120398 RepID=A0A485LNH2_9STRA|nr:hypothetical protein As57867_023027 [Aphanomyces stellatus]VFT99746.1 Aste57867_23098 [Aphanomyces stellatus]